MPKSDIAQTRKTLAYFTLGFSLWWTVIYIFAYTFVFAPTETLNSALIDYGKASLLGGVVLSQAAVVLLANKIAEHDFQIATVCVSSFFLIASLFLAMGLHFGFLDPPFYLLLNLCAGIGQGPFHIAWIKMLVNLDEKTTYRIVLLSIVVGGLFFMAAVCLPFVFMIVVVGLYAVASLVAYLLVFTRGATSIDKREAAVHAGDSSTRKMPIVNASLMIYGAISGTAIYAMAMPDVNSHFVYLTVGIALVLGPSLVLAVSCAMGRIFSFEDSSLFLLPILGMILIALYATEGFAHWAFYLITLSLLIVFDAFVVVFLLRIAKSRNLPPSRTIASGRLFLEFGMFVAVLINFIVQNITESTESYSLYASLVLVVFLLVLILLTNPYGLRAKDGGAKDSAPEAKEDTVQRIGGKYEARCRVLSEQYGLTSRELDVLMLLVKGNSAQAIAEKLFISTNTVRSHVGHIYHKMSVNSKQEVINLFEKKEP